MDCHETRELLWDLYEGELGKDATQKVLAHIEKCPECAREAEKCSLLNGALSRRPIIKAPAAATAAVLERVRPIARRRRALRWARANALAAAGLAAALVLASLAAIGWLPGAPQEEAGAVSRIAARVTDSGKTLLGQASDAIAGAVDYRGALSQVQPWIPLMLAAICVLVLFAALEQHIFSRRLEAKFRSVFRTKQ